MKFLIIFSFGLQIFIQSQLLLFHEVTASCDDHDSLYQILEQDCQPLIGYRGYHKRLQTVTAIMDKKRNVNKGYLPISDEAKASIVQFLTSQSACDLQQAKKSLQTFSDRYKLYPLSVQKTDAMIDAYYRSHVSNNVVSQPAHGAVFVHDMHDRWKKSGLKNALAFQVFDINDEDFS